MQRVIAARQRSEWKEDMVGEKRGKADGLFTMQRRWWAES